MQDKKNIMKINEINKQLYELAFIQNGEYGYYENNWKPSINERDIKEMCCDEDGKYMPATPMGYRDYSKSRLQGLRNIFDQHPCIDLTNDKYHHIKKGDNTIKLYDKIKTDEDKFFVVCGDNEDKYYVVDENNNLYFVLYEK